MSHGDMFMGKRLDRFLFTNITVNSSPWIESTHLDVLITKNDFRYEDDPLANSFTSVSITVLSLK